MKKLDGSTAAVVFFLRTGVDVDSFCKKRIKNGVHCNGMGFGQFVLCSCGRVLQREVVFSSWPHARHVASSTTIGTLVHSQVSAPCGVSG